MQHFYIKNLVIKQQQQQHKWKRKEVNKILKTKKRKGEKNRNKKKKTNKQNHAIVFNCHCPFCCGREKKNSIRKKYFKKP